MRIPQSIKRGIAIVLAVAAVSVSLIYFGLSFGRPYMGLILEFEDGEWIAETIDPNGVAFQAGVAAGDRVVILKGLPATTFLAPYEKAGRYSLRIDDCIVATADGTLIRAVLPPGFAWLQIIEHIGYIFVSLAFLSIGIYVQVKKQGNVAATLLFWCGPVIMLALSATAAAQTSVPTAMFISVTAVTIGPWILFHFFLVLPQERTVLQRSRLIYLIYVPAVLALMASFLIGYAKGQIQPVFTSIRFVIIGIGFLAASTAVAYNYFHYSSNRTRQQMKIIMVACLFGLLPIILISIVPQVFRLQPIIPPGLAILFFMFIPAGIGYAMVTQRLMNIDLVIRKSIVQAAITVLMAAILALLLIIIPGHEQYSVSQRIVFYLVISLLAAGLYGILRDRIGDFIDRHIYRTRHDIGRTIENLDKTMSSLTDYREISRIIVGTVANMLEPKGACLFLKGRSGYAELAAMQGIFADADYRQVLMDIDQRRDPSAEFPNFAHRVHPDLAFIIPFSGMQEEIGVLYISDKVSGEQYFTDDMYLLQKIVESAAVSLDRTLLIRDVSLRDSFISIASHELRSPLTAVMGYADLLQQQDVPDHVRESWVQHILDGSQRLSDIVDELLNVTRIQSGRTILKLSPVKVEELVRSAVDSVRSQNTHRHRFIIEIPGAVPDIIAEYDKIWQVFENLLTNAVKYSPGGGAVTVTARHEKYQGQVILTVADEGIGISRDDQSLLFTSFHRIRRPETMGIPGTGLGLFIVKKWVEAMGGRVWIESECGTGSTFYVAMPCADGANP